MKVHSLTILHYGADYLATSLRAVNPVVERSFIVYTPHPSHGHATDSPPIESREELMASIPADEWGKITWVDVDQFWHEGRHRDYALSVASEGADLVLTLDYDEIWPAKTLVNVLNHVWRENKARQWLLNFTGHFWRSFNYICKDDNWPVRVIDTRHSDGLAYIPKETGPVWHFGYAVTDEIMRYKMSIHGHKDEIRPDWFETKWQAWPPVEDCHPTNGRKADGTGWWNPEVFDRQQLPEVLHSHKWFNVDKIE